MHRPPHSHRHEERALGWVQVVAGAIMLLLVIFILERLGVF